MCQNKNDCSEKLHIVTITSKRVASNSVLSNDTTLPLAFCHLFIYGIYNNSNSFFRRRSMLGTTFPL